MRFKLVYDGFYFVMQEKVLQAFIRETRNPDSPDASLFIEPLHRPPCGIVIPVGFVHQIEVKIVQPELFHREVESPQGIVVLVVLHPQFGGYEEFLPFDTALPDGISQLFLVEISSGRIEFPITDLDSIIYGSFRFVFRNLKDTEPDSRHHYSIA